MIDGSLAEALSPRAAAAPVDPDIKLCPPGHKDYVIVTITGLKDDKGDVILEVYPNDEKEFLKQRLGRTDDYHPTAPDTKMCVEVPGPGKYAFVVHHDRDVDNKFDLFKDGYGFSRNPRILFSSPDVDEVVVDIKHRITRLTIEMHYFFSRDRRRMHGAHKR
jgi:uncharacterized protein (DUF2141 family)